MKVLSVEGFLVVLDAYLTGRSGFEDVREYVFQLYWAEEEFQIDDRTKSLFAAMLGYLQVEEALGDSHQMERMKRLRYLLDSEDLLDTLPERVSFALEFPKIRELTEKLNIGVISKRVYEDQLRKLSPPDVDIGRIEVWAQAHVNEPDINRDKIV